MSENMRRSITAALRRRPSITECREDRVTRTPSVSPRVQVPEQPRESRATASAPGLEPMLSTEVNHVLQLKVVVCGFDKLLRERYCEQTRNRHVAHSTLTKSRATRERYHTNRQERLRKSPQGGV